MAAYLVVDSMLTNTELCDKYKLKKKPLLASTWVRETLHNSSVCVLPVSQG